MPVANAGSGVVPSTIQPSPARPSTEASSPGPGVLLAGTGKPSGTPGLDGRAAEDVHLTGLDAVDGGVGVTVAVVVGGCGDVVEGHARDSRHAGVRRRPYEHEAGAAVDLPGGGRLREARRVDVAVAVVVGRHGHDRGREVAVGVGWHRHGERTPGPRRGPEARGEVDRRRLPLSVTVVVARGRELVPHRLGPDGGGEVEVVPHAGVVDVDVVGAALTVEVVGDLAHGEEQRRGGDGGEATAGGHGHRGSPWATQVVDVNTRNRK